MEQQTRDIKVVEKMADHCQDCIDNNENAGMMGWLLVRLNKEIKIEKGVI